MTQTDASFFVGIDVARDKLDYADSDSNTILGFVNDADGHSQIVRRFGDRKPRCVVIESTGGFEWPLIQALLDAGINVARVNPGNVRHIAIGLGILAKTDAIDARLLVRFAQIAEPRLVEKCTKNQSEIAELVACRRQLQQTLTQQTNRRAMIRNKVGQRATDQVVQTLQTQIKELDDAIRDLIDSDDQFKDMDQLLRSVPGVGPVASATLIAQMPELGKTDRREAPALLGVVPYNHDSGKLKGQRSIHGGRVEPRCVMYMSTLAAIRCNPLIKAFADRLRSKGKKAKVVIVACMRKLITLINAMLRDNIEWSQLNQVKNLVTKP